MNNLRSEEFKGMKASNRISMDLPWEMSIGGSKPLTGHSVNTDMSQKNKKSYTT